MLHHLNLKGSTSRFEERSSICRVLMLQHPKGSTSKDMRKEKKLLESVNAAAPQRKHFKRYEEREEAFGECYAASPQRKHFKRIKG
ncbi:uncharacterized protein [Palaemon carinicauda]|uniref:uncharacterized protein isoform X4 n=1 Tax=Palaemon carinicauda TaxID=392227 RepID=UPI0035B59C3A